VGEMQELQQRIRSFADRRSWDVFHTPKNLSMALAAEAGELLAEFQWLTADESMFEGLSFEQRDSIEMEIADVMIYLVRLCDVLQIDLMRVAATKLAINESRFPPHS